MFSVKNKKLIYVISGVLSAILLGIIITVCVLFIPLTGKKYESRWLGPNFEYNIANDSEIGRASCRERV